MLKRSLGLCALSFGLGALLLQAQDVFVLPGAGSDSGAVAVFTANPLSKITTFDSGNGSFLAIPTLDGSKFFVIADSTAQSITVTDSTFLHPTVVANLSAAARKAVMTPDGKLLAVAATTLHLFDTNTNNEIAAGGLTQGSGVSTFDVASSLDSSTLYALGSTTAGGSQLTAFNTTNRTPSATLAISQAATGVAVGPNGLVYVSLPNEVLELDPKTLKATPGGTILVTGTPSRLIFTPDGQYGLAPNQSSVPGAPLVVIDLATHTASAPSIGLAPLTALQTVGIDTVVGLSGQGIYEITISNPVSVTPIQIPGVTGSILALAASNEVPAAGLGTVQSVYAVTASNIYRINPATNAISSQYPLPNTLSAGALSFAAPTVGSTQTRPASLLTFGASQSILPGSVSEPLVVQVLDNNNHPVMGVTVQFQTSSNNGTLSAATATTQSNGDALTYFTASASAGPIIVTAAVGTLTTNFNIDVSTSAGGANSPRLTILAGQGQLMNADASTRAGSQYGSPLRVKVTDSNGNPLQGIPVTFTATTPGGDVITTNVEGATETVDSGADGTAQVDFRTFSIDPNNTTGYVQTSVAVTAPGANSVIYYITAARQIPGASVYVLKPTPGEKLTGPEGSVLPAAISAQVVSSAGFGIPNVSLVLDDGDVDPNNSPTVACNTPNGKFVLTTTSGAASCDVVFGPRVGTGSFNVSVGYTRIQGPFQFEVTPATPAVVQITQGNNQTGTAGQKLPLALVVHVTDSGGNIASGAKVAWQVLTDGAVTLSNVSSTTDSKGNASAVATLGSIGGVAQVKVTAGNASATFNLTVNLPSTGIQLVSGDAQTTVTNTDFASPLVVKVVDSSGNGVPGVQVTFQVTAGDATLTSASATTDTTGQATTTVTAGATGGPITVSAASGGFSVSFNLTSQLPGPTNITIVNGASFDANTGISPGGIATVSGNGILPSVQGLEAAYNIVGPLPTTFEGVTITFDGIPAPIYYVQNANGTEQVTVQIPFEVQPGPAVNLTVSVNNGGSATVSIPVKPLAPGVFTTAIYGVKNFAVAVRSDGSFVSPTNPAQRGEDITIYLTGLGQVTPATGTGNAGIPGQTVVTSLIVGLNNGGVPLISAEYVPSLVGVYAVTLHVPEDTATGPSQPFGFIAFDSASNAYFAQPTYIPIQ
jgi:uncharacterized protein (TIGR03437 family)